MTRFHYEPPPCTPDCRERSGTCHADCEKYAMWRRELDERKAARDREIERQSDTIEYQKDLNRRIKNYRKNRK